MWLISQYGTNLPLLLPFPPLEIPLHPTSALTLYTWSAPVLWCPTQGYATLQDPSLPSLGFNTSWQAINRHDFSSPPHPSGSLLDYSRLSLTASFLTLLTFCHTALDNPFTICPSHSSWAWIPSLLGPLVLPPHVDACLSWVHQYL